jgi:hypothetical protein
MEGGYIIVGATAGVTFTHRPGLFLLSLLPIWNEETMERLQIRLVTACSGAIVLPSAQSVAKVSLPTWVRALATARS